MKMRNAIFTCSIILSNLFSGIAVGFFLAGNTPAIIAVIGAQIAVSTVLFLSMAGLLTRPLAKMKDRLEKIRTGEGELDIYVESPNKDIVQALMGATNRLLDKFRRNIVSLKNIWRKDFELGQDILSNSNAILEGIQTISSSSDSLEETTGKLDVKISDSKNAIDRILLSLDEARKVFEEQSSAVEESSASVEQLISSIRNIARISEAKKSTLTGLIEIATNGKTEIDHTINAFSSVMKTTELMMDLVNVIGEIAEKTNLLSMNASIQATHAGVHGKGFAVVASEIKKLAESSRNAANTISTTLREIAEKISTTVQDSSSLKDTIGEIVSSVEETTQSMEEILNGMTEMSQGTSQISTALSRLVNTNVNAKQQTEVIFDGTGTIQAGLGSIESDSRLNFSAAQNITRGVHQISGSIELLFKISDTNSKDLTNMKALLDETKTKKRFLCDYIPPHQYVETDRITGVFTEIVELMCAETGEEAAIEFMPWEQVLALASKTPGIYVMTILRTAQREKSFRWIGPVVPDQHYIFRIKERSDIVVNSAADLRRYRVGCVENNFSHKYFIDSGVPAENILTSKIHGMTIQNLLLGKVELIPLGSLQAVYQLKAMNRPLDLLTKTIPITGFSTDSYMATSLLTPDRDFHAYERAFEKVRNTVAYKEILRKYST
jgi:methyl-accepting chemotaxis protein